MRVRELRAARGWSQAQLAERSGLSVRTVQRIENGAPPGLESLTLLAEALGVPVADLRNGSAARPRMTLVEAVEHCIRHASDIDGRAGRTEFWWFTVAVLLATAAANAIGPWLATLVGLAALVPWLSVAIRRLRDAAESPWWLLMLFVPVGGLVALAVLFAMPTKDPRTPETRTAEAGRP